MEGSLTALKLVLDRLGISDDISTVADRKRVQKAIYLTQSIAGIDLGYRFSWYLRGPYSSPLASDYYALAEAIAAGGGSGVDDLSPKPSVSTRLDRLRPNLDVPDDVPLPQSDWLELLASIDYLHRVREHDAKGVEEVLRREKSRLVSYYAPAEKLLESMRA